MTIGDLTPNFCNRRRSGLCDSRLSACYVERVDWLRHYCKIARTQARPKDAVHRWALTNDVCVLANEPAYLTHHVEGERQQAIGYIGSAGQSRL